MFKSIKNWSEDDKPREKLIAHGKSVLSDAELIAILLATGSRDKSALDLSKELLEACGGNLGNLASADIKALCQINGIGPAKAVTIAAAIELGNRRNERKGDEVKQLTSSSVVYQLMKGHLQDERFEQFWVVTVNRKHNYIGKYRISDGGVHATVADPKRIFYNAINDLASGIFLLHNHPSGNLKPSHEDIKLTKKIMEAGKHLDIYVLDHIIVTQNSYFSFADNGILND